MRHLRFIILVLSLFLGALFITASASGNGSEVVVILPTSGEVSITQGQMVRAFLFRQGGGWLSCSRGLDLDYRGAAIVHMELWRSDKLIQTVDKGDGRWNTSGQDPHPLCVHVNSPYLSNWSFDYLRFYEAGDYELRWTRGWSVTLSDGGDYSPVDGYPDLYESRTEEFVVLIHVEAKDWHWGYDH